MADSDSMEITLDVATEANPSENMGDNSEQEEQNMSRVTKRQSSAFSGKVMSQLIEMQCRDDMAFLHSKKMRNLIKMLESSSADDYQFRGNEKMHELMEKQFFSSADDMPFFEIGYILCVISCTRRFLIKTQMLIDLFMYWSKFVQKIKLMWPPFSTMSLPQTNMKGDTPLHVAARAKNLLAIKNILDLDKHFMTSEEVESIDKMQFIMLRNKYGRTALHEAVLNKDYSMVLFLLVAHKRSDLATYWTWNYYYGCKSPMYLAVLVRADDILYLLLRLIPIPSGKPISNGDSPLHAALSERNKDLLKMIVDTEKELLYQRGENNNTPLYYAAYAGYMEGVCIMLETSSMIAFQRNSNGNLPIHLACEKGNVKVVKKLLEMDWSNAGVFLNKEGFTARDVVRMKSKHPTTRSREYLANAILDCADVGLKANMLGVPHNTYTNEWNVKDAANSLALMAVLIATVTFTAGFTVPGGFYSSDGPITKQRGLALLADQTLFRIFMVFNTIAMYSSTIGSVILLWVPLGDFRFARIAYEHAKFFVDVALVAMPIAFLAAIRLIVSNNTLLAVVTSVIGFISIFFIIFIRMLGLLSLRIRDPKFRPISGLVIRIIIVIL
ncbi:protein ACCELERATED CELL DEATH 6 [Neltuma alba]|uniref:protein ACCELERATED CELL DEATH 6 n=1 Tax=Neltuma alba TaxID=207710 RepID=UPI0010A3CE22|nr:protein ACCELERATED CELL DEATH 6-like [Prosopis alba]